MRDAVTGDMSVWIDGEHAMRRNGTRSARRTYGTLGASGLLIDKANPVALCAGLDEVAVYEEALTPSLIYSHYVGAINQSKPYGPTDPGGKVPQVSYPDGNNASYYDMDEYPLGTILPSPGRHETPPRPGGGGNGTVCGGCMSCADQIRYAPAPRFNATNIAKFKTPFNFKYSGPTRTHAAARPPRACQPHPREFDSHRCRSITRCCRCRTVKFSRS